MKWETTPAFCVPGGWKAQHGQVKTGAWPPQSRPSTLAGRREHTFWRADNIVFDSWQVPENEAGDSGVPQANWGEKADSPDKYSFRSRISRQHGKYIDLVFSPCILLNQVKKMLALDPGGRLNFFKKKSTQNLPEDDPGVSSEIIQFEMLSFEFVFSG